MELINNIAKAHGVYLYYIPYLAKKPIIFYQPHIVEPNPILFLYFPQKIQFVRILPPTFFVVFSWFNYYSSHSKTFKAIS